MAIRARNGAVLAAIEAVEGTPETLSFVDDAILVADPTITLSPQNETTNEVTGSLDDRGPIVGGMQVSVSFDVYLKGSGTAGVAPEWGVLLRALGWAEVSTVSSSGKKNRAISRCCSNGRVMPAILRAAVRVH